MVGEGRSLCNSFQLSRVIRRTWKGSLAQPSAEILSPRQGLGGDITLTGVGLGSAGRRTDVYRCI